QLPLRLQRSVFSMLNVMELIRLTSASTVSRDAVLDHAVTTREMYYDENIQSNSAVVRTLLSAARSLERLFVAKSSEGDQNFKLLSNNCGSVKELSLDGFPSE